MISNEFKSNTVALEGNSTTVTSEIWEHGTIAKTHSNHNQSAVRRVINEAQVGPNYLEVKEW